MCPSLPWAGQRCNRPVNLLDIFPTLTQLCGIPAQEGNDGHNRLPLLKDPQAKWPHASLPHLDHGTSRRFGSNVVQVQLQFGKFMTTAEELRNEKKRRVRQHPTSRCDTNVARRAGKPAPR